MKIKKSVFILVFAGILCFPALSCSSAIAALVIQAGPHYANIDAISLTIDYPKKAPVLKEHYWDGLKAQFEQKLKKANLNVSSAEKVSSKTDVSLIVRIELLKVPDANLFAVRVETVMARQMLLATGSDRIFIVPLPLEQQGIRFVSEDNLPDFIEKTASQHIDQFLRNYQATKSLKERTTTDTNHTAAEPTDSTTVSQKTQTLKYMYVASTNSGVFHKPDCRWAKKISPANFAGYQSRDEAINDGKRPCKWCNP